MFLKCLFSLFLVIDWVEWFMNKVDFYIIDGCFIYLMIIGK